MQNFDLAQSFRVFRRINIFSLLRKIYFTIVLAWIVEFVSAAIFSDSL